MGKIKNLSELRDSALLYEKSLPPFGYILLISIVAILIVAIVWSTQAYKNYIVKGEGSVVSDNKNYIMSDYTGEIKKMYFAEGDYVEKGKTLLVIKSTDLDMQLSQLNGRLDLYQEKIKNLSLLEKSIKDDKNYFTESNPEERSYYNRFNEYKSSVSQFEIDLSRYQSQGYTKEQIENEISINEAQIAEVYYSALKSISDDMAAAQAEIDDINVQKAAINNGKAEYKVFANTSGIVHLNGEYKEGMVLQAAEAVGSIASENDVYFISAFIPARDRPLIDNGDSVDIAVSGLVENVYGILSGQIYFIDSDITNDSQTSESYFKILVKPDSDYLISKSGDKVTISNGMKVETRVKYDKVTYFQYVLESLGFKTR